MISIGILLFLSFPIPVFPIVFQKISEFSQESNNSFCFSSQYCLFRLCTHLSKAFLFSIYRCLRAIFSVLLLHLSQALSYEQRSFHNDLSSPFHQGFLVRLFLLLILSTIIVFGFKCLFISSSITFVKLV